MPSKRSHIRRAGRMTSLLAIALLTLTLPTQALNSASLELREQHHCSAQSLTS